MFKPLPKIEEEAKNSSKGKTQVVNQMHLEMTDEMQERAKRKIDKWKEELLDLSKSNPLIRLKHGRSVKLLITRPDFYDFFTDLVINNNELKLPFVKRIPRKSEKPQEEFESGQVAERFELKIEKSKDLDFEDLEPLILRRRLKKVHDNTRTSLEERGVNTLFVAFGTVCWDDGYYEKAVSPLLMVPCELIYKGPETHPILRMADDELRLNPTLEYVLRKKHQIQLPDFSSDLENNDALRLFIRDVKKIISGHNEDWSISEESWFGTFSFESIVLYKDLESMEDAAIQNPLILAMAGIKNNQEKDFNEDLSENLDSLKIPDVVPVPLLPVDSSQLGALIYAAKGEHLVVHGPPGTGKSQTITNIIADALRQDKKVLFVSAKVAALNVVFKNLTKIGLDRFCLEAHSAKAGKRQIIDELKKTLDIGENGVTSVTSMEDEIEELLNVRQKLNNYICELHREIQPLKISVYKAIGKYSKLQKVPYVKFTLPWIKDILQIPKRDLEDCIDALEEIAQLSEIYDSRSSHPWRGFETVNLTLEQQEMIEKDLNFLLNKFKELISILEKIKGLIPRILDLPITNIIDLIPLFDDISHLQKLPDQWWNFTSAELFEMSSLLEQGVKYALRNNTLVEEYYKLVTISPTEVLTEFSQAGKRYASWIKRIHPAYIKWKKSISPRFINNKRLSYGNIKHVLNLANQILKNEQWFIDNKKQLDKIIDVDKTMSFIKNPDLLTQAQNETLVAGHLQEMLKKLNQEWNRSSVLSQDLRGAAASLVSTLKFHSDSLDATFKKIDSHWSNGFVEDLAISQVPLNKITQRIEELLANQNKVNEWILLQRALSKCSKLNLGDIFTISEDISAKLLPAIFERRFWAIWISGAINRSQSLMEFSGNIQDDLRRRLRQLDERIRNLQREHTKVITARSSRRIISAHPGIDGGEISILRRELQRQRRIKPLRKLFKEIPHVLQTLKPCLLMSPVSVSTYLEPQVFQFDIVVFDEASQLPTAEALPSILRAKQVIVAGDANQLPPTRFFETSLNDWSDDEFKIQPDDEDLGSLPSLLNDCVAIVPTFHEGYLKWHYRSKDERLIKFSNYHFYDNKLITFPSPAINQKGCGVCLEYVENGVWDRGRSRTNRVEARRVAKLIIDHLQTYPNRTLGVVALNISQCEAIEDILEEEFKDKPDLSALLLKNTEEKFFVKSLENVQGDERDTIIISVGYAKDAAGRLYYSFGPINSEGGWKRLNVLVTRARWQTILVTSLRSTELHRVNLDNRGAVALKNFIEYGESGGVIPREIARVTSEETNDFEDSVAEILKDHGYQVDQQVGAGGFLIDIAIRDPRDPSRYLIGIECDGATYHSSRVARDRDLVREEILRNMGWRLHRVWSTDWFKNKELTTKFILGSVERAQFEPSEKSMPGTPPEEITEKENNCPGNERTICIRPPATKYHSGKPYIKYKRSHNSKILMKKNRNWELNKILSNIVNEEGPIHKDILTERIKEVFKVSRIGSNIRLNLRNALKYSSVVKYEKSFFRPTNIKLTNFRLSSDDIKRPIKMIPSEELALCVLYLVENQFGMSIDQIPHGVAKIFEDNHLDIEETDIIRNVVDDLIKGGQLYQSGNRVTLSLNE